MSKKPKRKIAKEYETKSAASCKVKSNIKVKRIYPINSPDATVNLIAGPEQAMNLATKILVLLQNDQLKGDFVFAGHRKSNSLHILRYKNYSMKEVT